MSPARPRMPRKGKWPGASIVHVLLGPLKGKYTDVDRPSEGAIDVRDGEQNERNKQREGEDLQAMESGAGRAEQTAGADGEYATHDEHKPENAGDARLALRQPDAAMFRKGGEFGESVVLGHCLRRGCRDGRHDRLPHVLVDRVALIW